MPGLKLTVRRASTRRSKYGGSRGAEMELRDAIVFYFQLRGTVYNKLYPKFIIPGADEFFTFAGRVDAALGPPIGATTTRRHRTLPVLKLRSKDVILLDFFHYCASIESTAPVQACEATILCLKLVMSAIVVYKQSKTHMGLDSAASVGMQSQIRWFCEHGMPVLFHVHEDILATFNSFSARFIETAPPALSTTVMDATAVGRLLIDSLDKFTSSPFVYESLIALPLSCALAKKNYAGCAAICKKLMFALADSKAAK